MVEGMVFESCAGPSQGSRVLGPHSPDSETERGQREGRRAVRIVGPPPHRAWRRPLTAQGSGIIAHCAFRHWDSTLKEENQVWGCVVPGLKR